MPNFNTAYPKCDHDFGPTPEPVLTTFCPQLDPAYPILDVGCGQGRHTFALARHPDKKFRVLAIDPSTEAIQTVQRTADAEHLLVTTAPLGFQEFDHDTLQCLAQCNALSAVLLFGLLQILTRETIRTSLDKTTQLLSKDGLLFITAFSSAGPDYAKYQQTWQTIGENSFRNPDDHLDLRTYFAPDEILDWIDHDHFRIIHHREYLGPMHKHSEAGPLHQHAMIELVAQRR